MLLYRDAQEARPNLVDYWRPLPAFELIYVVAEESDVIRVGADVLD